MSTTPDRQTIACYDADGLVHLGYHATGVLACRYRFYRRRLSLARPPPVTCLWCAANRRRE